ncbi:unnamed protein product [Phytophthora lilii]|uniref:Unnamed protein product n=1 Tax=Phytophthora lilii TaxID=2077276 RepID=A0A9W7CJ61_9STRA|nr:unnamed protein product [Phytophthora lilii]
MVKKELDLLDDEAKVYKLVGPVLLKQDADEAKTNVNKRLEFINNELSKVNTKIEAKEKEAIGIRTNVRCSRCCGDEAGADVCCCADLEHADGDAEARRGGGQGCRRGPVDRQIWRMELWKRRTDPARCRERSRYGGARSVGWKIRASVAALAVFSCLQKCSV